MMRKRKKGTWQNVVTLRTEQLLRIIENLERNLPRGLDRRELEASKTHAEMALTGVQKNNPNMAILHLSSSDAHYALAVRNVRERLYGPIKRTVFPPPKAEVPLLWQLIPPTVIEGLTGKKGG